MHVASLRSIFGAAPVDSTAQAKGPDFFCVGLQKGGTQWLYDQLQHHPDFWMPPFKELHYFDRGFPGRRLAPAAEKFLKRPNRIQNQREKRGDRDVDDRDRDFYERVSAFKARTNDLEAYAGLFEPKNELISGDITPGYSVLPDRMVRKIAARFDDAKVVMMLREPASRLWSHWRMHMEQRHGTEATDAQLLDYGAFNTFARRWKVRDRSYPTKIAQRWSTHFGDRFRYFFLDDVIARPDETRREILGFLGGDPDVAPVLAADFNRKVRPKTLQRSEKIQALMRRLFEKERQDCAAMFGGPAAKWPDAPY